MAKRIVIDPLNAAAVGVSVIEFIRFRQWLTERINRLCETLARDYALKTVADDYGYTEGGEIVCTAEPIHNGWVVKASGKGVFVLEYGAGDPAGTGPRLGTPPVGTWPGAYSDDHAGTYQAWVDAGRPGRYFYERQPRAGMYFAFRAANENVQKVAMEVFRT